MIKKNIKFISFFMIIFVALLSAYMIGCKKNKMNSNIDEKLIVPDFAQKVIYLFSDKMKGKIARYEAYQKYLSREVLDFYDNKLKNLGFVKITPKLNSSRNGEWKYSSSTPDGLYNYVSVESFWFNFNNFQLYWVSVFYQGDIEKISKSMQLEKQNVVVNFLQLNKIDFEKNKNILVISPSDLFFQRKS